MFGTVVDVAIGLIFIFLLFALFISTLIEIGAGITRWRARSLEVALKDLLTKTSGGAGTALDFAKLYGHPNVTGATGAKPSYISAENFASALLFTVRTQVGAAVPGTSTTATAVNEVIAGAKALPDGALKTALNTAIDESEGDWDRLKIGVETWFDHAMDRLSGEYKRYTQVIAFVLGLIVAGVFNIDAVGITEKLFADPMLRAALVKQAADYVDAQAKARPAPGATGAPSAGPDGKPSTQPGPAAPAPTGAVAPAPAATDAPPDLAAAAAAARVAEARLLSVSPMGWEAAPADPSKVAGWYATLFFGWLLTALAGMLGGPFWFDLLGKVINVRNAGPKPESSTSRS